jgi:Amino acid synthesis
VAGEMEHGGACVHPMLGKPMRAAVGGGKAVIGSNVKVAAPGALLDVSLGHKDDSWSFPHFDTISVFVDGDCRWRSAAEPVRYRADPVGTGIGSGTTPLLVAPGLLDNPEVSR